MCLIKTVAVVNDLSSFGNCSLTAAVAILAAMGHRPCPLPTAVLSAQSEFPSFYEKDLTASMPHYLDAWEANHERFDGICTGYFARGGQLDHAAALLTRFRRDSTLTLVDPVMGDGGALYPGYDRSACASGASSAPSGWAGASRARATSSRRWSAAACSAATRCSRLPKPRRALSGRRSPTPYNPPISVDMGSIMKNFSEI